MLIAVTEKNGGSMATFRGTSGRFFCLPPRVAVRSIAPVVLTVDTINYRPVSKRGCVCHVTRKLSESAISRRPTNADQINIRFLVDASGRVLSNFGYSLHLSCLGDKSGVAD